MNYRHAFHAGNFADVVKHAVLVRILVHLRAKPAAFRVIDTHAGAGLYDLGGPEAGRSGEWREGIDRLLTAAIGRDARALLAPYLDAVAAFNGGPAASPPIPGRRRWCGRFCARRIGCIACELEPNAAAALARNLARRPPQQGGRDRRLDRAQRLCAAEGAARARAHRSVVRGCRRFPAARASARERRIANGRAAATSLWYPIKERTAPDALARRLRRSGMAKILRAELTLAGAREPNRLGACGLIVVNPPWTLAGELQVLLPELAAVLSGEGGATHRVDWLAGEK